MRGHWSYLVKNSAFLQEKYMGIFFPQKILLKDYACQEPKFISYKENNMTIIPTTEMLDQ